MRSAYEFYNERTKNMNNKKDLAMSTGQFTANDKQGAPVIIEWQKTTLFAPEYAAIMKAVWPFACQAFMPVEMQFLRIHPEVVGTEGYYKPFEPFFKDGLQNVDWGKVEDAMQTLLKSHFIFDTSTWGAEVVAMFANDIFYVITVKDQQTNTLRGFITFMVRPNYALGDIKSISAAVDPAYQNRGLGKLLMSSMLKIKPDTKRIFMCTRVTNRLVLIASRILGFTKDINPVMDHAFNLDHWIFLEYKTEECNTLQEITKRLI